MKLFFKRCECCNSIWVCWNWFCGDKQFIKDHNKPHYDNIHLTDIPSWGHECWDCGNVQETVRKVRDGIPYLFLSKFHKHFGITCEHKNRETLPLGNLTMRGTELCLDCGIELIHQTKIPLTGFLKSKTKKENLYDHHRKNFKTESQSSRQTNQQRGNSID